MIETMKKSTGPVLLLDCGGVFSHSPRDAEKIAGAALESMTLMGYQGMNLGSSDFSLGTEFLKNVSPGISFPFISTNAIVAGADIPRLKRYEIIAVGDVRVAVLGILPTNALDWTDAFHKLDTVKIEDPEKAIRAVLPEIMKEKPDIVVLLSQLDFEPTAALVETFPEITAAVACGMKAGCEDDPTKPAFHAADGTLQVQIENVIKPGRKADDNASGNSSSDEKPSKVAYVGSDGKHLGILPMTVGADGKVTLGRETLKRLDDSVLEDQRIFNIVNKVYYRKPAGGKEGPVEQKTHQELMEGLKKSPQEFMEEYRKTHKDVINFPAEIFQKTETSQKKNQPRTDTGKGDAQ